MLALSLCAPFGLFAFSKYHQIDERYGKDPVTVHWIYFNVRNLFRNFSLVERGRQQRQWIKMNGNVQTKHTHTHAHIRTHTHSLKALSRWFSSPPICWTFRSFFFFWEKTNQMKKHTYTTHQRIQNKLSIGEKSHAWIRQFDRCEKSIWLKWIGMWYLFAHTQLNLSNIKKSFHNQRETPPRN